VHTALRILGVVLAVAGVTILAVGGDFGFSETHELGPITVRDRDVYTIPPWAGAALLAMGVGIFLVTLIPTRAR
jgi:uncharacterized membrane protein